MNTKIGNSFGLALLMAIGVIGTMLALGVFSAKPASADLAAATVAVTPDKARSIGQYTITVTGATGMSAIPVGGTITVTFNTKTTVPSSIASSAVKLKATIISPSGSNTGTANQLVSASSVTVSGNAVTITVPDMDPTTGTGAGGGSGDQGIAANGSVTITFTQAAGIQNPDQASTTLTLTVATSADTTAVTSAVYTITSFVNFTPSTAARDATVTVTGGGFTANCTTCKIRFNPQNAVAPTTGSGGSGAIDANGVFSGTITLTSLTSAGGYIWVTDSAGASQVSTTTFTQKAGATPRSTSVSPGATVSVDLVDYTAGATLSTTTSTTVGTTAATSSNVTTVPSTGDTTSLTPFKFVVPTTVSSGTHKVTITESGLGTKSATFNLEVVTRVLTVAPSTASPGENITVSGTGFTKSGTIAVGALTAAATGGSTAQLNYAAGETISVDATGAFAYATRMPTLGGFASAVSESVTVSATDGTLSGSSSGFKRTPRTLTVTPDEAGPGSSVTVSVTGMTVDNGEVSGTNAQFTISSSGIALSGTVAFPIGSDGTGTGTFTIPTNQTAGTLTITATDNALALNPTVVATKATQNQTATASLVIPSGTVSVSPASASTGNLVTITGSKFPPNTTGTTMTFGGANGIPSGGFLTDANGDFSVVTEVPAATTGGSLTPGTKIVVVTIGTITGSTTGFAIPNPSITITPSSAAVEDTIVISGTGFNSLGTATVLTIGAASAMPSPAPRASRNGDIEANVLVPLLNPGTYTVVLTNAAGFSATGTFTAVASNAPPPAATDNTEDVFADVISNDDNLVRVWRFNNATQTWSFYDPRPEFADANTLKKTGAPDIVWVNVNVEQEFQGQTLFPGWNLISLK